MDRANGRPLEWSFVTLFFFLFGLQLKCWQKVIINCKKNTTESDSICSWYLFFFKKKTRSTFTANPRSFFFWVRALVEPCDFLCLFSHDRLRSPPFITCSRKIGNLFPFFNSLLKKKMDKFLEYVEKHQNDFVERLRKAVAIPR